jgi:hypothetical protein
MSVSKKTNSCFIHETFMYSCATLRNIFKDFKPKLEEEVTYHSIHFKKLTFLLIILGTKFI